MSIGPSRARVTRRSRGVTTSVATRQRLAQFLLRRPYHPGDAPIAFPGVRAPAVCTIFQPGLALSTERRASCSRPRSKPIPDLAFPFRRWGSARLFEVHAGSAFHNFRDIRDAGGQIVETIFHTRADQLNGSKHGNSGSSSDKAVLESRRAGLIPHESSQQIGHLGHPAPTGCPLQRADILSNKSYR